MESIFKRWCAETCNDFKKIIMAKLHKNKTIFLINQWWWGQLLHSV